MSAALRGAARAGDVVEVERLLDGHFKGTQTSRRLERLAVQVRQLLREHTARHAAEPDAVPEHMTLEVFGNTYREANGGSALRPLDYGYSDLAPLLEAMPATCSLTYPDLGTTAVAPAARANSAAYNIAGGIPEARLSLAVDASDSKGRTSLWWAAKEGRAPVVQMLLDRNASADTCDHSTGNCALLVAAAGGHTDVVRMLLGRGANANAANTKGNTPIMVAHSAEIVRALIAAGGDATTKNFMSKPSLPGGPAGEPQTVGGPPRGYAAAQRNRMKATGRSLGDASKGTCVTISPFMCGPPNVQRGVHFGSDRSELAMWSTDTLPRQERTAADVQWGLGNTEAALFLEHHQTPEHSAKQAEKLLATGDSVAAAEAATVGLESIACSNRTLQQGAKMMAKEAVEAEHHRLEPVQRKLKDLLQQSRSGELRSALRRRKAIELLRLDAAAATALVEDRRWMPMGDRGTSVRVEAHHIAVALSHAEDVQDRKERHFAQKAAMIEMLLERHAAMLAARQAAAGQRDQATGGGDPRASQAMGTPDFGGRPYLARVEENAARHGRGGSSIPLRGMPAWS